MIDNWIQRATFIVATFLAIEFSFVISWMVVHQQNVPDVLQMAYVGAAGFIFGALVNMRTGRQPEEPPQQVEVVNEPADPVPTVEAKKK